MEAFGVLLGPLCQKISPFLNATHTAQQSQSSVKPEFEYQEGESKNIGEDLDTQHSPNINLTEDLYIDYD